MSAIDGLISGMATSDIIRQLMQLERQPVVRLQGKKTAADKAITALQGLNTKFLALSDLAKKFTTSPWTAGGVTSSNLAVLTANAAPGTEAMSLDVTVKALAAAHKVTSSTYSAADAGRVTDPNSAVTVAYLDANGAASQFTVSNHDGSLQSIAAAINAKSTSPVTATHVAGGGTERLEFTAKGTGDLSRFDVTIPKRTINPGANTPQVTFSVTTVGQDAEVLVGSEEWGQTIKSTSNTIEVAPGVSVALQSVDVANAVTVTVTEASKPAEDVQKLVDAANELLKDMKKLTAYDADSKKAGVLQGNRTVRELQSAVLQAVSNAVGGESAATAGIELTRDGTLTFDKATFDSAYAADPVAVSALFTGPAGTEGIAQRLAAVADAATKFNTGRLTMAIESRNNEMKRIDDRIAVWDVRLARKEAALRKQFAGLEVALGTAQQQGNWLASQINSLPSFDTN